MDTKLTAYDSLLLKYKPRPIRNDREHRRALKHVDELIGRHGPAPPRAEGELIAVLSTLIESYEVETVLRRKPTSAETLEHLIDSKQVTRAEVANIDWPTLLDPIDDLPPANIITSARHEQADRRDDGDHKFVETAMHMVAVIATNAPYSSCEKRGPQTD